MSEYFSLAVAEPRIIYKFLKAANLIRPLLIIKLFMVIFMGLTCSENPFFISDWDIFLFKSGHGFKLDRICLC